MEDNKANSDEDGIETINAIPICDRSSVFKKKDGKSILLVSTLDGTLTALDPENQGTPIWTVGKDFVFTFGFTNNHFLMRTHFSSHWAWFHAELNHQPDGTDKQCEASEIDPVLVGWPVQI